MIFKKLLPLVIAVLFLNLNMVAQDYSTKNKKAIKLYEAAAQSYNLYFFDEAEIQLMDAIDKDENFIEAYILLAQVYSETDELDKAIKYLEKSVEIDPSFFGNSFYFLGEMHMLQGNYSDARKNFSTFLDGGYGDKAMKERANLGVKSCNFAEVAKANPVDFKPVNLGPKVNTENPEYFPCITADKETLLFTRLVKNSKAFNGKHEDFFVSSMENGEWTEGRNLQDVNSLFNEGAPTLSPDGQILIFTACEFDGSYGDNRNGKGSCDLFYSSKVGERWNMPQNLGEKINSYYWESQPSFSADGQTLFFVRGRYTKNGIAKQDIYTSKLNSEGQWEKASKIKGLVNTEFEEESVMIHPDGKTLYFSSNGHPGMGGMDIFMSKLQDNGEWGEPVNLGYPINTEKNENSILVASDGQLAFFSSNREGGYGDMDLYTFELPDFAKANKVTYMKGLVLDANSYKKLEARFELIDLETGELVAENYSNPESGEFLVCLPSNRDYALNVSRSGYLFYSENFSLKGYDSEEPFFKEILLSKLRPGATVVLKNVFFETNKYDLDEKSFIELDRLVALLELNPELNCEISGHTDNVGNDEDNQKLSLNRAAEVVSYLESKGIDVGRLSFAGYGEKKPIADNSTEEGRALNRRTEFRIL